MKRNMIFALLSVLTMTLCCCNNKKTGCVDCKSLGVTIPAFEKKFPEKKVTLDPDYIQEGYSFTLSFSSMEEAEYKIVHCVLDSPKPTHMYLAASYDLTKKVIQSDTSSFSYPFDTLIEKADFTVVDSEDGQVRCYGWHHLYGTSHWNPELMVQYKGNDGTVYTVDNYDFANGDYMPEDMYNLFPEKVYRIQNNEDTYTIIWGIYGASVGEGKAYYGLVALKMDENGVFPVPLFMNDELEEGIVVDYCIDVFDEDDYELIRFDPDEPSFYFPNLNEKYVWNGEAFVLHQRDEDEALQLILTSIANGDKETFADLVRYPLCRDYPLRDIKNKKEMIKYFDFLFDDEFRNTIKSLTISDWHLIGWRGFTVLSGELWEDGGELVTVNYSSPAEQRLRDSLIKVEFDALHSSLQGNWEPIDRLELADDEFSVARIDRKTDDDNLYRLSLFAKKAQLGDKPRVCLNGHIQYEGTMGDGYCRFESQDTVAYYVFGVEHEDCVPARIWKSFSWMERDIPYKDCYYQIDYAF